MNQPQPPAPSDAANWEPPRWRVTLWSMVAVQFIMSISFGIVGPIMPLYLPELGVVSPAAVNMWAGVLTSATSCVAIFTSPLWGGLADRHGRKLMVLRSTPGIAVFTFLMGIAQGPWQMLGLRAGMGALAGFSSASVVMVMMMGQFATQAVLPVVTLYVREILGVRPEIATLGGLAFSATGLAGVLAVPFLGRRSDRIGYRRTLLICLFGAALFTLPMAAPFGYWAFVAERFGLGLFIGAVLPVSNAMVGRLTDPAQRGMAYGVISSAYFIGNTTGPLAGGAIAATVGINWVFAVTGALLAVNFVWVWFKVPDVGREE